ncbi:trigger factor [Sulfurimonas sp. SWIR-19]|uniref:trigger factor n=1 Tax=Sulfurimonas sp. SWIR-19 TaxID=2878390 RepID=UPI001CF17F21|nr:trigger factor [Sulfurimonas sp. SWIR-19]UCN00748.1 trigger factor [Sulfurimonas sp. SWIR-19]
MKVSVKKIDDINFIMSGTVENRTIETKVAEFKEKLSKDTNADAQKSENIEQEAAGEVFKEFINAGIKEANIDIETILGQPLLKKYEQQGENVYFEVALSVSPVVDVDALDYSEIVPDFTKPKADPEAVEAKLTEFVQQQAPFIPIEKPRPLQEGDVAVIDFKGFIEGKPFEGGSAEKFNLKIGSNSFIPGFEEQLIGMEYGEERSITVTFPEDYQAADLAGKETKFDVKLHEIQEQKAQTPDDAFAQKILSDPLATLETLKEKFADQIISEELSRLYMEELKPKIVNALLEKFDFTLPANIVEQEIDAKVREKTKNYTEEEHKQFLEDKEKFLQLRESVRKEAQDVVKTALIVEALAKKEGIEVHLQEVHAALGYQAMMTGQDAQELVKYYEENNLMTSAKMGLTEDKLFGKLLGFHKQ